MKPKALLFFVAAWLGLAGVASAQLKTTVVKAQSLPASSTQQLASASANSGAQVQAALPVVSGSYECVNHVVITAASPTATVAGTATISDGTWTKTYQFVENAGLGGILVLNFPQPVASSATGTAITATLNAIASGANASLEIGGYSNPNGC